MGALGWIDIGLPRRAFGSTRQRGKSLHPFEDHLEGRQEHQFDPQFMRDPPCVWDTHGSGLRSHLLPRWGEGRVVRFQEGDPCFTSCSRHRRPLSQSYGTTLSAIVRYRHDRSRHSGNVNNKDRHPNVLFGKEEESLLDDWMNHVV